MEFVSNSILDINIPEEPIADELTLAPPLTGASQTVSSIDLMQSELTPKGAIYTRVKGFTLPQAS